MSCDTCKGYSDHNCPTCRAQSVTSEIQLLKADETKFDILHDRKIVAVCSLLELQAFIEDENLKLESDSDGDNLHVSGAGFEFWGLRQHDDSMDLFDRAASCDYPISMHLFAGFKPERQGAAS